MVLELTLDQEKRFFYLSIPSKIRIVKQLLLRYELKNLELEKYRDCSSLKDGWQTSSLAKKQRKAEELSKEITIIRNILFDDWNVEI